ncbi:MAG: hypothetical protein K8I65_11780 [Thermoanaerobaculia bacterium]|nr:hypothetical protein [Thermoanaerobaculia bacterium]
MITVLGTVASFRGAWVSIRESRKAAMAATEAERARMGILQHRQARELSELQSLFRRAANAMAKYGPGGGIETLIGANSQQDAREVLSLLLVMGEWGCRLTSEHDVQTEDNVQEALRLLESFDSCTAEDRRPTGSQLLLSVNALGALLSRVQASQEDAAGRR